MLKRISTIIFSVVTIFVMGQSKIDYKKPGAPIPPFAVQSLSGNTIINSSLVKGRPVIIMLFSPQCDHCQHALDSLRGMTALFRKTQLLPAVEARNKPLLKDFMIKNGFDKVPLFRNAGSDNGSLVYNIYSYGLLPQFNIYNEQHKLVKTFTGNFPMDSLRMFIK